MTVPMLLPWFPIILGVGVGTRAIGRVHGAVVGVLCALFWIVLINFSGGAQFWSHPSTFAVVLVGAVAIVAMGLWSGDTTDTHASTEQADTARPAGEEARHAADAVSRKVSEAIDQFDDWLETHRTANDPWLQFDEFVRALLFRLCGATHVRPFRLRNDGIELVPLRESDPLVGASPMPVEGGIVGRVASTGRVYRSGSADASTFGGQEREPDAESIAWCFPVVHGKKRLGAVAVGMLHERSLDDGVLLQTSQRLVSQFWRTLWEALRCRDATTRDPTSGLRTRDSFLAAAEQSLNESYAQDEPVALVVIAIERLRELCDSGRWDVADEVVREAAAIVAGKVRLDDRAGRFDGSRFVVLLRRVDSELASLIVAQLMARLTSLCTDRGRWRASITVRCGMATSGDARPDLTTLMSSALRACGSARSQGKSIVQGVGLAEMTPANLS